MKSTLFKRAMGRRDPPGEPPREGPTPTSVNDSDIYFDQTPRNPSFSPKSDDDDSSRPPPTNPKAISPPHKHKALKVDVDAYWSADEEFDRPYDLSPVSDEPGSDEYRESKRGNSTER